MSESLDLRWRQRFQNFDRAFLLLRQAMEGGATGLNQLEREGSIQRFKRCFELAWKTVKDFMEAGGFTFALNTPRQVLKDAYSAKVIEQGQVWVDMLDHRNLLSHTYDLGTFDEAVRAIETRYLAAIGTLHGFLQREASK